MKSEPIDPKAAPPRTNSSPLMLGLDDILLRPSAQEIERVSEGPEDSKPRISLERFQELEQCIRNAPVDPEPYLELAGIYLTQQRWRDARRVLDSGVNHNPDNEQLLILREEASLLMSRQQLEGAKQALKARKTPENEKFLEQAELDLANLRLRICEERMARHPEQVELVLPCAIALRQLGRMSEAVQKLKIIENVPEMRARACLQMGMCYQQMGRVLESLSAYRKAATYRAPPPPIEVRARGLELAADLALQHGLVHAARQYLSLWLEVPGADSALIRARLNKLKDAPL